MGSGTTALAAIKENRRYIGFELEKKYYDICIERIEQEKSQLTLF
jgi:DNA modification methylase